MEAEIMDNEKVTAVRQSSVPVQANPAMLLTMAVEQGADLDKLEKLMDLQERWEKNEARKAYIKAMSEFKKNPPDIIKDAHVDYTSQKGRTQYDHATLANITTVVGRELGKHGLAFAWSTKQNGKISVTCTITHELGHSESTSLEADADSSGGKNNIQAIGSTITYFQRYTLLALTGLAAKGQDDDGRSAEPIPFIAPEQAANIIALLGEYDRDVPKFLKILKAETISHIRVNQYERAVKMIQNAPKDKK